MVWHKIQLAIKRIFDISLSLILLVLCILPLLLLAVLIKLTSPGSAINRQIRVGHLGNPFVMYKLRSIEDCEPPRITTIGHQLRRWGIDELPQFYNILKGDMSFVGPRPLNREEELGRYRGNVFKRRQMKPGLLADYGLEIHGSFQDEDRITSLVRYDLLGNELDLGYVDNWSITKDVRIFMRAFKTLLQMIATLARANFTTTNREAMSDGS